VVKKVTSPGWGLLTIKPLRIPNITLSQGGVHRLSLPVASERRVTLLKIQSWLVTMHVLRKHCMPLRRGALQYGICTHTYGCQNHQGEPRCFPEAVQLASNQPQDTLALSATAWQCNSADTLNHTSHMVTPQHSSAHEPLITSVVAVSRQLKPRCQCSTGNCVKQPFRHLPCRAVVCLTLSQS
jgi:hypothetical protein